MEATGTADDASDALLVTDVPYASPSGESLLARIYRSPRNEPGAPAVIDVHAGAWHEGDRTWGRHYNEALARRGYVVVAIDFRQAPRYMHPAGSADVATAVRWVWANHETLGIDPSRIGLVGSSSGGHLALLAACRPTAPEHEVGQRSSNATVRAVAALWPPVDPLARYQWAGQHSVKDNGAQRDLYEKLRAGTERYFGDEEQMAAASIARIVADGEATHLPRLWMCHAELDENVPYSVIEQLQSAWRAAGGEVQVTRYAGQRHAFGQRPGPATDRFIEDLSAFLATAIA